MKITKKFLRKIYTCSDGRKGRIWFHAHPELDGADYSIVCAALDRAGYSHWSVWLRWGVAGNSNTSRKALARLAKNADTDIRIAVAENTNTSPEVLKWLVKDAFADVRTAVAGNRNTPPAVLAVLAKDKYKHVRAAVACNRNTPSGALVWLIGDKKWCVRQSAKRRPSCERGKEDAK